MKFFSSLTNRIFLASAGLTVLTLSVAIYLVSVRITAAAEDELVRCPECGAILLRVKGFEQ